MEEAGWFQKLNAALENEKKAGGKKNNQKTPTHRWAGGKWGVSGKKGWQVLGVV